ncbi:MAG: hypothetical protein MJ101_03500 [Clostridia bacterium]|nr:hypothetical protein [Clostridia bacterium]
MNIDRNDLNKFIDLDDGELDKRLSEIAYGIGMDPSAMERAGISAQSVRNMLCSMSQKDISDMLNSLGQDTADKIVGIMRGGNGG